MLDRRIRAARKEFNDLQASIEDRRQYAADQEKLIKSATDAGNNILRELEVAITYARTELKAIKMDIRNLTEDKKFLEQDIAAMQQMM